MNIKLKWNNSIYINKNVLQQKIKGIRTGIYSKHGVQG